MVTRRMKIPTDSGADAGAGQDACDEISIGDDVHDVLPNTKKRMLPRWRC